MIRVIAADDEELAGRRLERALKEVFTEADVRIFNQADACLEYVVAMSKRGEKPDYAFLDIQMDGTTGLELAKQIKNVSPTTRILFVTAYNTYARESYQLHVLGYILKPVDSKLIEDALDDMEIDWRTELKNAGKKRLQVSTFGKFEVMVDGVTLDFPRKKCKELLALLIDRQGEWVDSDEIIDVLWENEDVSGRTYYRKCKSELLKILKNAGVEDAVLNTKNGLSIVVENVDCDYFLFCNGNVAAVNSYHGIYMEDYSWAEFTTGYLTSLKKKSKL